MQAPWPGSGRAGLEACCRTGLLQASSCVKPLLSPYTCGLSGLKVLLQQAVVLSSSHAWATRACYTQSVTGVVNAALYTQCSESWGCFNVHHGHGFCPRAQKPLQSYVSAFELHACGTGNVQGICREALCSLHESRHSRVNPLAAALEGREIEAAAPVSMLMDWKRCWGWTGTSACGCVRVSRLT